MAKYTPMMEQYFKIKQEYQHCILFYRLGDFYEMFFEDAITASKELEITLTGRDCGQEERAPMCGVPFHSADSYIARLIDKGYRVAICEQVEDPKSAKGIVRRDVIRVITPGTVLDTNVLDESKNNYIMALYENKVGFGVASCDVSTGEFSVTSFNETEGNKVIDEIARFSPKEVITSKEFSLTEQIKRIFDVSISEYNSWSFESQNADICLCNHFKTLNLDGFGLSADKLSISAAGALLQYLLETQKNDLSHISSIKKYANNKYMVLDISSRRNLELTQTIRDKSKKGSLLWVLDKTETAMGARLLRSWIERPLISVDEINSRLDAVGELKQRQLDRAELRELLSAIFDIERLMGRVIYTTANARDLINLKASFEHLPHIKTILNGFESRYINEIADFDELEDIYSLIEEAINPEPPFSVREGDLIREGYNPEVDKLRLAKNQGSGWLMDLEAREKEATGIKNLRVKYNKVFGYYIEITNSYLSQVPDRYIRKQTLTNCERFITPELKEIEDTILGANDKIVQLEYDIFCEVRNEISAMVERINKTAYAISVIDSLQSLGEVADKEGYVRPTVSDGGGIDIVDGRHPVVEKLIGDSFIPNDTKMDLEDNRLSIITGPNMAGKSTYMRQVALLVLMSQLGSFIPAKSASIGITDRIFTRIGASDDLVSGQSTFMIEMVEVANILNNATRNSLLILDEIGRGTSTFDGLSIAWAVLEHIASKKKLGARTLFATHYHELTELEGKVKGVVNYCISVLEEGDEVIFLRKIIRGGADKSYGIHVASLAGVPNEVLKRADEILKVLGEGSEEKSSSAKADNDFYYTHNSDNKTMLYLDEISSEIKGIDIDGITPRDAWQKLYELKEKLSRL